MELAVRWLMEQWPKAQLESCAELTVVTDVGSVVGEKLVAMLRATKFPGAL